MATKADLEAKITELIAWCEANTGDETNLRETLTLIGMRLGDRANTAYKTELESIKVFRNSELAKSGKAQLILEEVAVVDSKLLTP